MRIDRLHVKNFKGFEDRVFEFPRSLDAPAGGNGSFHLLIGQNGKGKTSALDALAVAAGGWFCVHGLDNFSVTIHPVDVRIVIQSFGDTERMENQFPVIVEAEGQVMGQSIRWIQGDDTRLEPIKSLAEEAVRRVRAGKEIDLPLIRYYGTGRLWLERRDRLDDEELAKLFDSRLAGYTDSLDSLCSPHVLLSWLKFEQLLSFSTREESTQFQVVKHAIQQAVENCTRVDYHLRLGLLLDIEGQPRLPFGALSDGQRNMIALVGDLAFKAAQMNPHMGEYVLKRTAGIVLIDELDLHLHPRWQRRVVEDLRRIFPEIQFIASTHSPFIVQTLRKGELVPLDTQPIPETGNLGVEEIARGLMGVDRPEVSPRYATMKAVAKNYLAVLEEASRAPDEKLKEFKEMLAKQIAPYADNPAFQAFLEMEQAAVLGNRIPGPNEDARTGE